MGHDDMHKKTTRYSPHAHDPLARTWANDFNNLALGSRYEKTAAPFSKRRNSTYQPVDRSRGGFYGLGEIDAQEERFLFSGGILAIIGGTVGWMVVQSRIGRGSLIHPDTAGALGALAGYGLGSVLAAGMNQRGPE